MNTAAVDSGGPPKPPARELPADVGALLARSGSQYGGPVIVTVEAEPALPVRSQRRRPDPVPEPADEPRRPTYKVKPHETLRSIARDTLNDSTRDREILSLNRDIIDDPTSLSPGTVLTLPEDAVIGRRAR